MNRSKAWSAHEVIVAILVVVVLRVSAATGATQYCTCSPLPILRFGGTSMLSGANYLLGTTTRDGIVVAFDEYNARDPVVDDKRFELSLDMRDDEYDPQIAKQNVEQFAQDDTILAILGSVGTASCEAAAPVAIANNLPFLSAYGGTLLRMPFQRQVVTVRGSYFDQAAAGIQFLVLEKNKQRIAFFGQNDAFGATGLAGVLAALDSNNLALHCETYYSKTANASVWTRQTQEAIANMSDSTVTNSEFAPDAIVLVATIDPALIFIQLVRQKWPNIELVLLDSVTISALADSLTSNSNKALDHLFTVRFTPNPATSSDPLPTRFRQVCTRFGFGDGCTQYTTFEGYLIGRLVIAVLERIKTGNYTRENFLQQLYAQSFFNLDGFRIGPFYPETIGFGCNQGIRRVHIAKLEPNKSLSDVFMLDHQRSCSYEPKVWSTLKFGQSCSFTGSQAVLCQGFRDGILAAFKEVNDGGGVRGNTRLQLETKDDHGETKLALINNNAFLEDPEIFALVGTSPVGIRDVVELLNTDTHNANGGKLLFGAFTGDRSLREPFNPRIINFRASVDDEVYAIVQHCYYTTGTRHISVLYENTEFGSSRRNQLVDALKEKRWTLDSEASYADSTNKSVSNAVNELFHGKAGSQMQAVVFIGLGNVLTKVLTAIHSRNRDIMVYGLSHTIVGADLQHESTIPSAVNLDRFLITGCVPDIDDTSYEVTQQYASALARLDSNAPMSAAGLEGYIVGQLLAIALTRIMGKELQVSSLIDTVFEYGRFNVFGFPCGPLQWITSNATDGPTSCNQCMKRVFLMNANSAPWDYLEPFTFDDSCMYIASVNLDFELNSTRMTMVIAASIGIGLTFLIMILLVVYRDNKHLRFRSLKLSLMSCLGAVLSFVSIFTQYPVPDDTICMLQPWVDDLAFVTLIVPLVAVMFRVDRFFSHKRQPKRKKHHKQLVSDMQLSEILVFMYLLWIVILVGYMAQDAPRMREGFATTQDQRVLRFEQCLTDQALFPVIEIVFKGIILLWGCFVSQRVYRSSSHRPNDFVEARSMAVAMAHSAFMFACLLLVQFTITQQSNVAFIGTSCILVENTAFLVAFVFGRPALKALRGAPLDGEVNEEEDDVKDVRRSSSSTAPCSRHSVIVSSVIPARLSGLPTHSPAKVLVMGDR